MKYDTMKIGNGRSPKRSGIKHRLLCVMLLSAIVCSLGCGGSHVHQIQARELIDSIHNLLISERLCIDKNDCRRKEYAFIRPSTVIDIYTYGITNQSIAKKIVGLCIDAHAKNPGIQYELTMYAQTKAETLKEKQKTTMLKLILEKEE